MTHLLGIKKDLELLQKTVEHLNTKMINLHFNIDSMEVKTEFATIKVLKEVFKIKEMPTFRLQAAGEEGQKHLEPERNLATDHPEDSTQEECPLEKMEGSGSR